jgi:hypothetical protein|tara:strand:+ start:251 stop:631 length:381 start_codon:yes stop_codon:yes gene_type:complete
MTEQKKRVGRPSKKALKANTSGTRGKVGRPKGDAGIMNEYKAMMLTSPKSPKILSKILDAALDDDHKNQAAAWKIFAERAIPIGLFDDGTKKAPSGVTITINTVDGNSVAINEDPIDGDYEEVDDA